MTRRAVCQPAEEAEASLPKVRGGQPAEASLPKKPLSPETTAGNRLVVRASPSCHPPHGLGFFGGLGLKPGGSPPGGSPLVIET